MTRGDEPLATLAALVGAIPMVVLAAEDVALIGGKGQTATFSADTAGKQRDRHPELTAAENARAQEVVDGGRKVQDGPRSLIYILEEPEADASALAGGYVLVVKATQTGEGLFFSSYRRLSRQDAERDTEVARLLNKGKK